MIKKWGEPYSEDLISIHDNGDCIIGLPLEPFPDEENLTEEEIIKIRINDSVKIIYDFLRMELNIK